MRFSLRRNLYLKIFSFLLAVACWFVVSSEEDRVKDFSVPIDYVNLPPMVDLSGRIIDTLSVRLRGPEGVLRMITEDRLLARIDLTHAVPGEQTIAITHEMIRLPAGAEVVRLTPELLPIRIERRMRREVPVVAEFAGAPAHGYVQGGHLIEPPTVTIEGPSSELAHVARATTGTILLTGQSADYEVELTPIPDAPPGSRVHLVSTRPVRVRIAIEPVPPSAPAGKASPGKASSGKEPPVKALPGKAS